MQSIVEWSSDVFVKQDRMGAGKRVEKFGDRKWGTTWSKKPSASASVLKSAVGTLEHEGNAKAEEPNFMLEYCT